MEPHAVNVSVVCGWRTHLLTEDFLELLGSLWVIDTAGVDAGQALSFHVVYLLFCHTQSAADEGVVCFTVCTVETTSDKNASEV